MDIDKTTLDDLSVFRHGEEIAVADKLDRCTTTHGSEQLRINFSTALKTQEEVMAIQQTLKLILHYQAQWPRTISNGTVMVVEKYFDSNISSIPSNPSSWQAYMYKLLHGPDYALVTYSAKHCFDFIKGFQQLLELFSGKELPAPMKRLLDNVRHAIDKPQFAVVARHKNADSLSRPQLLHLAHFIRYHYKHHMHDLVVWYAQLDAWYGMAMAVQQHGLVFPEFVDARGPVVKAEGLYHLW